MPLPAEDSRCVVSYSGLEAAAVEAVEGIKYQLFRNESVGQELGLDSWNQSHSGWNQGCCHQSWSFSSSLISFLWLGDSGTRFSPRKEEGNSMLINYFLHDPNAC